MNGYFEIISGDSGLMKLKSVKGLIASELFKGPLALGALMSLAFFPDGGVSKNMEKSSEHTDKCTGEEYTFEALDASKIPTKRDDSYLFRSREDASKELERLKKDLKR